MTEDYQAIRCVECVFLVEGQDRSTACTALKTANSDIYAVFDCSEFEHKNPIEQDRRNRELNQKVIRDLPFIERKITMADINRIVDAVFKK